MQKSEMKLDVLVVVLTFAAGSMDAFSLIALGSVFTSALSGNTIFLGIAIIQGRQGDASRLALVFAGFLLGAAAAAGLFRRDLQEARWSGSVTRALTFEVVVLAFFLLGLMRIGTDGWHMDMLVAASAFAMGIQSMVARRLDVSGVATTYVTGTITSIVYSIVVRPGKAARDKAYQSIVFGARSTFLVIVWTGYLAGAAACAYLEPASRILAAAIPLILVLGVVIAGIRSG